MFSAQRVGFPMKYLLGGLDILVVLGLQPKRGEISGGGGGGAYALPKKYKKQNGNKNMACIPVAKQNSTSIFFANAFPTEWTYKCQSPEVCHGRNRYFGNLKQGPRVTHSL